MHSLRKSLYANEKKKRKGIGENCFQLFVEREGEVD